MWISNFSPGTTISFTITNHGSNPFILNFETTDVTVYDDQSPPHVYPVTTASGNHASIQAGPAPWQGTSIGVAAVPVSAAKHWTVTFKAISGRQNVTIVYTLG